MKNGYLKVRKGQKVRDGTVLGEIGLSGRTKFPHIHFSVRKNGKVIDPFDPDGKPHVLHLTKRECEIIRVPIALVEFCT